MMQSYPSITRTSPLVDSRSGDRDAFNRLRVSEPVTLFDSSLRWDLQSLNWYTAEDGETTVAHNQAGYVEMIIGAGFGATGNTSAGNLSLFEQVNSTLKARQNIEGIGEIIALCARALTGTVDVAGAITWQEIY